jgi:hypothetical protein
MNLDQLIKKMVIHSELLWFTCKVPLKQKEWWFCCINRGLQPQLKGTLDGICAKHELKTCGDFIMKLHYLHFNLSFIMAITKLDGNF